MNVLKVWQSTLTMGLRCPKCCLEALRKYSPHFGSDWTGTSGSQEVPPAGLQAPDPCTDGHDDHKPGQKLFSFHENHVHQLILF